MENRSHRHSCYVSLSLFFLICLSLCSKWGLAQSNKTRQAEFNIGVILDFDSWVGKVGLSCIQMALNDFYMAHGNYTTRLVLHRRDSKNDVVVAASVALDLLKNAEVQAIIGPQKSAAAVFVTDLGMKTQVPIISFSATSPALSSIRTPYFIRTAQSDSTQVKAITAIVQAFSWREVTLIYEDTDYGVGVGPSFTDAFQEINVRVPFRSVIPLLATDDQILRELYKLMTMQTRVFVVHISPSLAARFFPKVKEAGMMSKGYVWIVTDGITDLLDSMDSSVISSMQGVLGVRPYIAKLKQLDDFRVRWKRKFRQLNPDIERVELTMFGSWAYDTVWALAMAAESVGITDFLFQKPNTSENSTELENLSVSQTGPELLKAIWKTEFNGLSGAFHLVDGELQASTFQLVNMVGKGEREIGFWTPTRGISQDLNSAGPNKKYSVSMNDLAVIIWPGESISIPKGWVFPTGEKKMTIGVPVKEGFREFVSVERDPRTNESIITGFSIDVFKAVMETLPYSIPYEFIPFQGPDGHMAGSYNDLIYQVYLQRYDAVAGDTTIIANRSLYVDFTLPYTEAGVSMVAPMRNERGKNAWTFLKPLSADLWVTSWIFFIFTGTVVWVLEHTQNPEFGGQPSEQLGTIMWFGFSTMVFANRERVISNLTKFVLIIWFFVVLVLTQSYTASLSSMLTVERLLPTISDVSELKRNGDYVGYQKNSFVLELLKEMGFDESRIRPYRTPEQLDDALTKGSRNGGVSAIFHEVPYLRLFLSKYCSKYTMVGPIHQTAGFGYVFPKGSPLVSDVSRAILNVTQGERMTRIQQAWFGNKAACSSQGATVTTNNLTLNSFSGLFLVTGIASVSAISVFLALFLYKNRDILGNAQYGSNWENFVAVTRRFYLPDPINHPANTQQG